MNILCVHGSWGLGWLLEVMTIWCQWYSTCSVERQWAIYINNFFNRLLTQYSSNDSNSVKGKHSNTHFFTTLYLYTMLPHKYFHEKNNSHYSLDPRPWRHILCPTPTWKEKLIFSNIVSLSIQRTRGKPHAQ